MTGRGHSVSVAGVVLADGRALLARRADNGRWEPPGGVLEREESIEAGLAREVREETGLAMEVQTLTGVYKNHALGVVALVFACARVDGELTVNPEVTAFRWVSSAEVDELMVPAFAVRVRDAFEYRVRPAIRSHDGTNLLT